MSSNSRHVVGRRGIVAGLGAAGALVALPAWAGFGLDSLIQGAAPALQGLMLGEDDEIKLGETYYESYIEKGGGRYPDRNAQEALKAFAAPFIATSTRERFEWDITLLRSKDVNAWAIPGGKLAINSELVRYVDDPAELGSVISHEIGHADLSHGIQQMRTQGFMQSLGALGVQLLTAYAGQAAPLTGELLNALQGPVFQMINAGYSRTHEFEADNHILGVFEKTGMDPTKASIFFQTLQKLYPQNSDVTTSLFSTHPGTQARIEALDTKAASLAKPKPRDLPPGWGALKEMFPTPKDFHSSGKG